MKIFGVDPRTEPSIKPEIGYVSEYPSFYSKLTVKENLVRFGNLKGVDNCREAVEELIRKFESLGNGGITSNLFSYPINLFLPGNVL